MQRLLGSLGDERLLADKLLRSRYRNRGADRAHAEEPARRRAQRIIDGVTGFTGKVELRTRVKSNETELVVVRRMV